jgi:hypothetical protein
MRASTAYQPPDEPTPRALREGRVSPPSPRREYRLVLGAAFVLYVGSMAPGVLWQDSGLSQIRVLDRDLYGDLGLALAHPLYYVLALGFQYLPFGESAFKTNMVSVFFGAVTVANVFLLLRWETSAFAAVLGAFTLAVAHTFWQHCALAEVYTVSTALLTAELICLSRFNSDPRRRWLVLLFFSNGLGVSNHLVALLSMACYATLVGYLAIRRRLSLLDLLCAAAAWTLGAGLYLGMIAARVWAGEPLGETLSSALFGHAFADNVLTLLPPAGVIAAGLAYVALNFPTPTIVLLLPGLAVVFGRRRRRINRILAVLLVVHLLWAIRYDVPDQYTFFIPTIVILSIVIGLGAERFLSTHHPRWRTILLVCALLPPAIYVPLPVILPHLNVDLEDLGVQREVPYRDDAVYFLHPWKTGYRNAERFARHLADMLPPGSVLVADTTTVRPLHYMLRLGRWRTDVRLLTTGELNAPGVEESLRGKLAAGLVYVVTPSYAPAWLREGYQFERVEIVYRVLAPGSGAGSPAAATAPFRPAPEGR